MTNLMQKSKENDYEKNEQKSDDDKKQEFIQSGYFPFPVQLSPKSSGENAAKKDVDTDISLNPFKYVQPLDQFSADDDDEEVDMGDVGIDTGTLDSIPFTK